MRSSAVYLTVATAVLLLAVAPARARTEGTGILQGIEAEEAGGALRVTLRFSAPVAYLNHAPADRGNAVRIQLRPLGRDVVVRRQTLHPPRDHPAKIRSLEIDVDGTGEPFLEVRFASVRRFRVERGEDPRRLVLRLEGGGADGPAAPRDEARAEEMMEEGRRAITAGEWDRAVAIFSGVLQLSRVSQAPDALELLGLARERKGQLAHARAEYQSYLERFPEAEGVDRVSQRLSVIALPQARDRGPLRIQPEDGPRMEVETFGRLYAGYRRESLFSEGVEIPIDDSIYSDVHLDTRIRRRTWTIRSQLAASLRYDIEEGDVDPRFYSAFIDVRDDRSRLSGSFGRRRASEAGVIGRFDGLELRWEIDDRWELGAVAGLPLDTPSWSDFGNGRYLAGLNLGLRPFSENVQMQLFGIVQTADGKIDRGAIGGEARWFDDGRMLATFLDYDVYFNSLNVAQIFGSWDLNGRTFLSGTLDHRNVPVLTSRNALLGLVGDLGSLGSDAVKDLARDQTGRATSLTFNASHRITPEIQIAGDINASHYTGTDGTLDIPGVSGSGIQLAYTGRIIVNEMLVPRDVGIVSLRYFDGKNLDQVLATFDARFPVLPQLRLNPRAWIEYRTSGGANDAARVRGSLRSDLRFWLLDFEAEVGGEWTKALGGIGDDAIGYFFMLGARYDF